MNESKAAEAFLLFKRASSSRFKKTTWKEGWFFVQGHQLCWFEDFSSPCYETLELRSCSLLVLSKKGTCIWRLNTTQQRKQQKLITLRASSEGECDGWIAVLQEKLNDAKNTPLSKKYPRGSKAPTLPDELVCCILQHLPLEFLAVAGRTCKQWYSCTNRNNKLSQRAIVSSILLLQWGLYNGCTLTPSLCELAAERNCITVLRWLRTNGCIWSRDAVLAAAVNKHHWEVVEWVSAQQHSDERNKTKKDKRKAVAGNDKNIIKILITGTDSARLPFLRRVADTLRHSHQSQGDLFSHNSSREVTIMYEEVLIKMVDIGAQKSSFEWLRHFDNVLSIMFCVSLDEFDELLPISDDEEDLVVYHIQERLQAFEALRNEPSLLPNESFLLYFTRTEVFEEKIRHTSAFHDVFSNYNGKKRERERENERRKSFGVDDDTLCEKQKGGNNADEAQRFILGLFLNGSTTSTHAVYPLFSRGDITADIQLVYKSIRETVLSQLLNSVLI
ncbi:Guanine nucleotide-binding protein alpha-2 subunit [Balamuthia mandrillaris]